jgi:hypothetical protein
MAAKFVAAIDHGTGWVELDREEVVESLLGGGPSIGRLLGGAAYPPR